MTEELSVIICTHNPREDYLRRTLESVAGQSEPGVAWGVTIVDSGSDPALRLEDLEHRCPGVAMRVVREDLPGLTRARLRGIRETSGALLVFVDDDNVLNADYLSEIVRIAKDHPTISVFGPGKVTPEFEEQPDPAFAPLLPSLVIRDIDEAVWSTIFGDRAAPYGAGMVVRRETAARYLRFTDENAGALQLDRTGKDLMGGGDVLFSFLATKAGEAKGLFPELGLTHLISAGRVQRDYLLRLAYGNGLSEALFESVTGFRFPRPGLMWRVLDYSRRVRRGSWTAARARMLQHRGFRDKLKSLGRAW